MLRILDSRSLSRARAVFFLGTTGVAVVLIVVGILLAAVKLLTHVGVLPLALTGLGLLLLVAAAVGRARGWLIARRTPTADVLLDTMDHKRVGDELVAQGTPSEAVAETWTNSALRFVRAHYPADASIRFIDAGAGTTSQRMEARLGVLGDLVRETKFSRGPDALPEAAATDVEGRVVPDRHRQELQEVAAGLEDRLELERKSVYSPVSGPGSVPVAQSFRAHFPEVAQRLDMWDELVDEIEEARHDLWAWLAKRTEGGAPYALPPLVLSTVVEHRGDELPWQSDPEYLMLGGFVIPDVDNDDPEAKRPFDDLLAEALKTNEAADLQVLRELVDDTKKELQRELELIQRRHVIRGQCELCA